MSYKRGGGNFGSSAPSLSASPDLSNLVFLLIRNECNLISSMPNVQNSTVIHVNFVLLNVLIGYLSRLGNIDIVFSYEVAHAH